MADASTGTDTRGLALAAMMMAAVSWAVAFPMVTIALEVMTPLVLLAPRFWRQ